MMLLEVGFIGMFFTPNLKTSKFDILIKELIKWLAFRLYYASGVLKLTSECPTWWGLTALNYHFES